MHDREFPPPSADTASTGGLERFRRGATLASYVYNAEGQRVAKTAGGATQHFIYGPDGALLGVYDAATGAAIEEVLYRGRVPVATVRGGAVYFIHTDHLGTPRLVTAQAQTVVWRWTSDPFGAATPNQDPDGNGIAFVLNLRFPGQYHDAETGRHYNYFRDYDPAIGRYAESDLIGLAGGAATYAYVKSNPLRRADPYGLDGCFVDYPGYPITIPGTTTTVPLGHAGVLSYDADGRTRYYEYGRYDSNFGEVKRRAVPDLKIGPDGKPTSESWDKLMDALRKIGHGTEPRTSCEPSADAKKINDFAEERMHDPQRAPYSWNPFKSNTCKTFASDALGAGRK